MNWGKSTLVTRRLLIEHSENTMTDFPKAKMTAPTTQRNEKN